MTTPEAPAIEPSPTIRAFDQNGNEVLVPREQWRTEILPNMLRQAWGNPDQLYQLILNSLNEGFGPEVAPAAEHLYTADPLPARGTCVWAILLISQNRLDEAESVLRAFLATHGDEGSVLTNLAKLQSLRGQHDEAEATLWHALEVEPNLDHGLAWYAALQQEKAGEPAASAALERLAALTGSWRAHLWLARAALAAGNLPQAQDLYNQALARAPQPIPGDFLMQMSGDLGAAGHIVELLHFTAPHFVPDIHGLAVGNNIIKAHLDLHQPEAAAALVATLSSFNRPDWKSALDFWTAEITRAQTHATPSQLQIGMLRLDGPIWLPPGAPGWSLFGEKPAGGPAVTFLGGTAESPRAAQTESEAQANDLAGRLSRALPLFLAEQVELRSAATGRAMLPWAVAQTLAEPTGFVVGSAPWTPGMAVQSVTQDAAPTDIVVTVHLDASVEPWTAELVFLRTDTGAESGVQIGELDAEFPSTHPEQGLPALAEEVIDLLGGLTRNTSYQAPAETQFGSYLQRLEQLLAIRCAAMPGVPATFLHGEQDILENNLAACAADPTNLASRLLLLESVNALDRIRPEAAAPYRERLESLLAAPLAF